MGARVGVGVSQRGSGFAGPERPSAGGRPPRFEIVAVAVAVGVAVGLPLPARAEEMVRIAVATGQARVELSGPGLSATPLADGQAGAPSADGRAEVALQGDALLLDGRALDAPAVSFEAQGPIRLGALALSGAVEVRRGASGLDVIHSLPLEDYVAAVVEAEMPPGFPPEALKAQAVAARSFALAKKLEALAQGRAWHLGSTVLDQVYRTGRDPRARAAALATAGEVLAFEREPVLAFFHSACGGRTESGEDALGRALPYLASVRCGRCQRAPRYRWTARVPLEELGRAAGLPGPATSLRVVARTAAGRVARVAVSSGAARVELSGADLRQRLGWDRLPSLAFEARIGRSEVSFQGRGSGHGAGMCQWGAAGFAREGRDYRFILDHYYPGTDVLKMY
jgi:stage II sporulation protein D